MGDARKGEGDAMDVLTVDSLAGAARDVVLEKK